MGEVRENVKRNLGYFLSLRGMSQKELAIKLDVSQSAVTNWIKGKNSPDIEAVVRICRCLDISVEDLFGIDADKVYSDREMCIRDSYKGMEAIVDNIGPTASIEKIIRPIYNFKAG